MFKKLIKKDNNSSQYLKTNIKAPKNMSKSDIQIAREAKMEPIVDVLAKINVPNNPDTFSPMGRHVAKINFDYIDTLKNKKDGKLILVTAITPTPAGEGKTTVSVGLSDGINKVGEKSIVCLREPS